MSSKNSETTIRKERILRVKIKGEEEEKKRKEMGLRLDEYNE